MGKPADFKQFFLSLSEADKKRLATDAKTTVLYIETHLIAPPARRKVPRKKMIEAFVESSVLKAKGLTKSDLLEFFYQGPA